VKLPDWWAGAGGGELACLREEVRGLSLPSALRRRGLCDPRGGLSTGTHWEKGPFIFSGVCSGFGSVLIALSVWGGPWHLRVLGNSISVLFYASALSLS
jgi:hypothetical protein